MDRDTVVRLMQESGAGRGHCLPTSYQGMIDTFSIFATLIANETLERAAKVCEDIGEGTNGDKPTKIAYLICTDCADAIRALKE